MNERTGQGCCGGVDCAARIREHMPVIASCGRRVGTVDRVEGGSLKLTRSAPAAHGEHRYIPLDWIAAVDESVRLSRRAEEVERDWKEAAVGAGA
jgi:hypothetical protein